MDTANIITIVFCCLTGAIFVIVGLICLRHKLNNFDKTVKGIVVKTEVNNGGKSSGFKVTAQYGDNELITDAIVGNVDGKLMFSSHNEAEETLSNVYPLGSTITVYIDSKKGEVCLFPHTATNKVLGYSLIAVGILFAVGGLILGLI